jgi:hydroxyethylthiazole kinase
MVMSIDWRSQIAKQLDTVRAQRPLIHNITNYVVMNLTANALLALGASPVMAHAEEEVEEIVALAGALVLNLGTVSPPWIAAMRRAAHAAQKKGIPIVLDPVGAGASRLRTTTARRLLQDFEPNVVRANASEILALVDEQSPTRGVDSRHSVEQARSTAIQLARQFHITVAVTGPEDYITDGQREGRVNNGHSLMSRVTGTGCTATALAAAFCAIEPDSFAATIATLVVFGIAGELAARDNPRPGSFLCRLLDALDEVDAAHVRDMAKFTIEGDPTF